MASRIDIAGSYDAPTRADWSMPVGVDAQVYCTINPGSANLSGVNATLYATAPDGSVLFSNVAQIAANVANFTVAASNTNSSYTGPYNSQVKLTGAGNVTVLSEGQLSLTVPRVP